MHYSLLLFVSAIRTLTTSGIFMSTLSVSNPTALTCSFKSQLLPELRKCATTPIPRLRYSAVWSQKMSVERVLSISRAGVSVSPSTLSSVISSATADPVVFFDSLLGVLVLSAVIFKAADQWGNADSKSSINTTKKPPEVRALQGKFLVAFWLLRCGYWMSGPYVVPAYKSKVFGDVQASMSLVSKIFLCGFAATAIFGPIIGQATDRYGRKAGTMMFALLYGLGCLSIRSQVLWVLFAGRALVGCALGLLFTAPEAWVNGEARRTGLTPYLGETFGMAYTGDALVAIAAGKLASWAAATRGFTGPFDLAMIFLAAGGLVAGLTWKENKALMKSDINGVLEGINKKKSSSMKEAFDLVCGNKKLILVGAVQSLFEAVMYVFILQWPQLVGQAVGNMFGASAVTPFGTIFSCFMTCSLLGSLLFTKSIAIPQRLTESTAACMLAVSTMSIGLAAVFARAKTTSLAGILGTLLIYETCVGMYFPVIGTIRSKLIPDDQKAIVLSLFGVPLNTFVVLIYLSISKLGLAGSLWVSSGALVLATGCMMKLRSIVKIEAEAST